MLDLLRAPLATSPLNGRVSHPEKDDREHDAVEIAELTLSDGSASDASSNHGCSDDGTLRHDSASSPSPLRTKQSSKEQRIADASTTYYPHPTSFKLSEHPIDQVRQLNVAIIGAGLSGLTAGALLPIKVPGIKVTIFEKNSDIGGVWHENIYPGVRCDIPAHVYQSSFSPNTQWTEEYAAGAEIKQYWRDFAEKHNVVEKVRLSTSVNCARWDTQRAEWSLEIEKGNEVSTEYFDFVVHAIGRFNNWRLPEYPGLDKYKRFLCHASNWDPSFDATGKRIAIIGNGASGVQILPALRGIADHIDHYARNPTWVASAFIPHLKERLEGGMPIDGDTRESLKDEDAYLEYRKKLEDGFWRTYEAQLADTEASKNMRPKLTDIMKKRLGAEDGSEVLEKLIPDFPPHCRRLTPAPGYLESLIKENVTLIQTPIERFTEEGIVTKDGTHRPVDAVICATGANTDCAPPMPIISGEIDLQRDWKPDGKFGFPYNYLGVGVPGFPNMSFVLGPNPVGPTGTLVNAAEAQVAYIAKMLRKISTQGIRTITPSKAAADDFIEYCDAFFPRTNLAKKCSSWSNGGIPGARIHGHWPGSASHLNHVRREPRWEDFEYTYLRPENRFAYFGNGWTSCERDEQHDVTTYLRKESENDLRNLHELWWDL